MVIMHELSNLFGTLQFLIPVFSRIGDRSPRRNQDLRSKKCFLIEEGKFFDIIGEWEILI